MSPALAYIHGAFLVFIDSFGSGTSWSGPSFHLSEVRKVCGEYLKNQTGSAYEIVSKEIILNDQAVFGIPPFQIIKGLYYRRSVVVRVFLRI